MAKSTRQSKPVERTRRRKNDTVADWASVRDGLLRGVVEAVTAHGGAIRFGYSKDGGAFAVGVYGDGDPFTEYLPATSDVDEWLEGFRLDYE